MSDSKTFDAVVHNLVRTAKAHHEATGGVNPEWARWYAEYVVDDLNDVLGSGMDVEELADWLTEADRRYREEPQEHSWPKAYAAWLIDENQTAG
jgi:aromatic ring-opening dioxygenase catalytic subunit (LigB family)